MSALNLSKNIDPAAQKDILELEDKIRRFRAGEIPEDKFKHFRLTRGVYGQRQLGVQMVRIKIPHGRLTARQLIRIADVSEKYATGNLHLTTRQDIQLHFVKLDDSPKVWAELEEEHITLREACGNTVRNVTASAIAGIDPKELFDITPYAEAFARYFLRNPVCQDMGRKFKVAFSSADDDSGFTYFHDLGFIPRIRREGDKEIKGFKVLIGGGLGAQAMAAQVAYEFLPADEIIPFAEAVLRVFDRYGERVKRHKARFKFLIQKIGLSQFMQLVEAEKPALRYKKYVIDESVVPPPVLPEPVFPTMEIEDQSKYERWLRTNTFEQKQKGFYGVYLKIQTGDISHHKARALAGIVKRYAADDIRVTVNQGLLLRYVRKEALPALFAELDREGLAEPGFDSTHDITTCPGTDTCNLGVTNSMELARVLERLLREEYDDLIYDHDIKIKISGCMNSCGQHMAAQIGFHGSSIKKGEMVAPAMQVVLGGGVDPDGTGFIGEKIVKLPTRRIPQALRLLLNDFQAHAGEGEYFNAYFRRQGKTYFYQLLKPLAETELTADDFIDWGHVETYEQAIGVGECAGIMLDVVSTVISEAAEKFEAAKEALQENLFADAIYNSYNTFVIGAKALLLSKDVQCNTQAGIIKDFNEKLVKPGLFSSEDFETLVYQINKHEPDAAFASKYLADAAAFLEKVKAFRAAQLGIDKEQVDKQVIANYYRA
ncbi:MAG: ferredoxin--nitrite reductase [Chitinophagales bacterium]|nr:MAG: ferredoxin--nitrite reductase [Chitinophagales bacterium]